MEKHIVAAFDEDLDHIDRLIREMGELGVSMVAGATNALLLTDRALSQRVISDDVIMDAKQREVDDSAVVLLAKRQPMASDLRSVVSAIRMGTDLERIGDLAKNIAKRVDAVGQSASPRPLTTSISTMSDAVVSQIVNVMALYTSRDASGLERLRADDEKVDAQYTAVFRELLTYMMEDPRNITACTHLLFCAKNLERIGDHVTNIAENAYYVVTGAQLPASRPKVDETAASLPAD